MSEKRVSNRDRYLSEQRAQVKRMQTGDIIAEMIEIGNPNSIHTQHRKQTVKRFDLLKQELNARISLVDTDQQQLTHTKKNG